MKMLLAKSALCALLGLGAVGANLACGPPPPPRVVYPAFDFPIPNPLEILNSIIREVRNVAGQLVPKTFMDTRVQIRTGPTTKRTERWPCDVVMAFPSDGLGQFVYWPRDPNWGRDPVRRQMWNDRCAKTARSSGATIEAGVYDGRFPLVYWMGNRLSQPYYPVTLVTLLDVATGRGVGVILNTSIGTRDDLWTDYYFVAYVHAKAAA